jgi:hypothetical protein
MGVVYEAQQISLKRRVALKVLPFAAVLDPRQLQRFQNEAQTAACLHHTSIVPVYAVGCERGVHFFAMQYIDGQSLADLIRELHNAQGPMTKDQRMTNAQCQSPNDPVPDAGQTAGAYAEFAGKSLPTVVHWARASGQQHAGDITSLSNFGSSGPVPVGSKEGLGPFGTLDMVESWLIMARAWALTRGLIISQWRTASRWPYWHSADSCRLALSTAASGSARSPDRRRSGWTWPGVCATCLVRGGLFQEAAGLLVHLEQHLDPSPHVAVLGTSLLEVCGSLGRALFLLRRR